MAKASPSFRIKILAISQVGDPKKSDENRSEKDIIA